MTEKIVIAAGVQECLNFLSQTPVFAAGFIEKSGAFGSVLFNGFLIQFLELLPALRIQSISPIRA